MGSEMCIRDRDDSLAGPMQVPPQTESVDLVPVAQPESGTVSLMNNGSLVTINTAPMGCSTPSTPATYQDVAYVVCAGQNKVLRLAADGKPAGDAVETPGDGDAELLWDEDQLVMNVPGADEGIVIGRDGHPRPFDRSPKRTPGELGDPGDVSDGRAVAADDRGKGSTDTSDESAASLPNPDSRGNSNNQNRESGNELPDPTREPEVPGEGERPLDQPDRPEAEQPERTLSLIHI